MLVNLILAAAFLSPAMLAEDSDDRVIILGAFSSAAAEEPSVLLDSYQRTHTIYGDFPLFLQDLNDESISDATRDFLSAIAEENRWSIENINSIVFGPWIEADESTLVAQAHATKGGQPLLGAEASFLFDVASGELKLIASIGLLFLDEDFDIPPTKDLISVEELGSVAGFPQHATLSAPPVLGWSWYDSALVWQVETHTAAHFFDARSGELLRTQNQGDGDGSGNASITVFRYNGQSPDFNVGNTNPPPSPATTAWSTSTDWLSNGALHEHILRRTWSISYPINQIIDVNTSEVESIVPTGTAPFSSTNTTTPVSHFRQQETYRWLRLTRDWFVANVFGTISPYASWGISSVTIDLTEHQTCGSSNTSACYSDSLQCLEFKTPPSNVAFAPRIYAHEYGHHIVNLYGNRSNICVWGSDEGDVIDEALADTYAFAILGAHAASAYGSTNPLGIPGTDEQHTTSADLIVYGQPACNGVDPYTPGHFWRQAMWELLHNYNCSADFCDIAGPVRSTFGVNQPWTSQSAARIGLMRAVAYADKVLPQSTTFHAFAATMHIWLQANYGSSVAAYFKSVLNHHNVLF